MGQLTRSNKTYTHPVYSGRPADYKIPTQLLIHFIKIFIAFVSVIHGNAPYNIIQIRAARCVVGLCIIAILTLILLRMQKQAILNESPLNPLLRVLLHQPGNSKARSSKSSSTVVQCRLVQRCLYAYITLTHVLTDFMISNW